MNEDKKTNRADKAAVADTVGAGAIEGADAALKAGGDSRDVAAAAIGGAAAASEAAVEEPNDVVEETVTEDESPKAETFEATPTLRAIHKWVSKRVHSSPLSRDTEIYNHLMKHLPELASMIDQENKA